MGRARRRVGIDVAARVDLAPQGRVLAGVITDICNRAFDLGRPWPESTILATPGNRVLTWARSADPSIPGMRMSLTRTSNGDASSRTSASSPLVTNTIS